MIITDQVKCDVCPTTKGGETNHWLVAVIVPPEDDPREQCIAFAPMGAAVEEHPYEGAEIEHICSHACAVKRFSQWLGTLAP